MSFLDCDNNAANCLNRLAVHWSTPHPVELCRKLGVKKNVPYGWVERDSIPFDVLVRISSAENLSLDWMWFGHDKVSVDLVFELDRLSQQVTDLRDRVVGKIK